MLKVNPIPKVSLLILLSVVAYLAVLILLGQQRALDWGLTDDELLLHEKFLALLGATGIIATWFLGMYRAHLAGSWRWFLGCMFFWPAAYVYTLFFNPGLEA